MKKPEMIYTDNPYVDIITYYTKYMAINAVVKNQQMADNNETIDSLKMADIYIACVEQRIQFDSLEFNEEVLREAGIPDKLIANCLRNKYNIPESKRAAAVKVMRQYIIDHYDDGNNYYRMIHGMPNVGEAGIKLTEYDLPKGFVIDTTKYLHEMNEAEGDALDELGVIDRLLIQYPKAEYLKYIGSNRVDYYKARTAFNFQLLFAPNIEFSNLHDKFLETYDQNRAYTVRAVYSDAMKYESDYYDNFIVIFIMIQTMVDIISNTYEMVIRKDAFDSRSVRYLFESFGIPYFSEIPLKYQISMVKNVNTLLRYKSTSQGMIDICSIFGFDDVRVFKYYILKDRKMDKDGNFIKATKQIENERGEIVTVPDNMKMYDLKFIKVPLKDKVDPYLKAVEDYLDYDPIALGDPYWNGEREHNELKEAILDREFSYAYSKYISIDNVYDLAKLSFEMPYFINMLLDNVYLEDLLTLDVPYLSNRVSFKVSHLFCFLFALGYAYKNIADDIMDTQGKVLHILGFNFKADLTALGAYLKENLLTPELAGIADFTIPKSSILSFNQLLEIFTKNSKVFYHLRDQMVHADNKRIYDIYKTLYESLMIIEYSTDFFKLPDGTIAKTYTDYLQVYSSELYLWIIRARNTQPEEDRLKLIGDLIDNVIYALDQYIDSTKFRYLYYFLPTTSVDAIKQYISKVIDFFKSYKVTLLSLNTIYVFDDKFDNKIDIIDDWRITSIFNKDEYWKFTERISKQVDLTKEEHIELIEKMFFDISTWGLIHFDTIVGYEDKIADMISNLGFCTNYGADIKDKKWFTTNLYYKDVVRIVSAMALKCAVEYKDKIPYKDKISEMWCRNTIVELVRLSEKFYHSSQITKATKAYPQDMLKEYNTTIIPAEYMEPFEKLYIDPTITVFKYVLETGNPEYAISLFMDITYSDKTRFVDTFGSRISSIMKSDVTNMKDACEIVWHHYFDAYYPYKDKVSVSSNIGGSTVTRFEDKVANYVSFFTKGEYGINAEDMFKNLTTEMIPQTDFKVIEKISIKPV